LSSSTPGRSPTESSPKCERNASLVPYVIGRPGVFRRPRQLLLLHRLAREQEREIARRAERPLAGDAHEVHAAPGIGLLQFRQQRADVCTLRQTRRDVLARHRLG
jgi:hypothetical protein